MDAQIYNVVSRLHRSQLMFVMSIAGAGSEALSWILSVPGASRTLLEATVPYSASSLVDMLGYTPSSLASKNTASEMADAAFDRAKSLADGDFPVAGLACSAAICSERPKRGSHRAHVAVRTEEGLTMLSLELEKGLRDRLSEERLVSLMILKALANSAGLAFEVNLELSSRERLDFESKPSSDVDALDLLLSGAIAWVYVDRAGGLAPEAGIEGAVMPGSFNPLHEGHIELRAAARKALGENVTFEMSISNVDKSTLRKDELQNRLQQLKGKFPVLLTRADRFQQKAKLFPGSTFVVGYDTAIRLVDNAYYGDDSQSVLSALSGIRELNCHFLVAGRVLGNKFYSVADVAIPEDFEKMFTGMPESAFRNDISSSDIRAGKESRERAQS